MLTRRGNPGSPPCPRLDVLALIRAGVDLGGFARPRRRDPGRSRPSTSAATPTVVTALPGAAPYGAPSAAWRSTADRRGRSRTRDGSGRGRRLSELLELSEIVVGECRIEVGESAEVFDEPLGVPSLRSATASTGDAVSTARRRPAAARTGETAGRWCRPPRARAPAPERGRREERSHTGVPVPSSPTFGLDATHRTQQFLRRALVLGGQRHDVPVRCRSWAVPWRSRAGGTAVGVRRCPRGTAGCPGRGGGRSRAVGGPGRRLPPASK